MIYLDYVATTPLRPEVLSTYNNLLEKYFFNADSMYDKGIEVNRLMEHSRKLISEMLKVKEDELIFTSCGSESNNLAIKGVAFQYQNRGKHIITTAIEHSSVYETCKELEKTFGFEVTYLNVDKNGIVNLDELRNSIRDDTILISIMMANNEVGVIEPIKEIGDIARQNNIIFHTDAVQAVGHIIIDVNDMNIDALSISAHKFYGPKGIGSAYIKRNIDFDPVILGGHQEHCKRAGTENVPGIVGIGKAIEIANLNLEDHNYNISCLRDCLLKEIKNNIDGVIINADIENKLPGSISLSIDGVDSRNLLLMLDMNGICVSSGSACNSNSIAPSHVLTAMGLSLKQALSTIRITLGDKNTMEDIKYIAYVLKNVVINYRKK